MLCHLLLLVPQRVTHTLPSTDAHHHSALRRSVGSNDAVCTPQEEGLQPDSDTRSSRTLNGWRPSSRRSPCLRGRCLAGSQQDTIQAGAVSRALGSARTSCNPGVPQTEQKAPSMAGYLAADLRRPAHQPLQTHTKAGRRTPLKA